MYAITGVSGHTGSVAADTLLSQGKKVRVIVRDAAKGETWKAKGADVAVASLDDAAALTRAFTGVEGAFVLLPPSKTTIDPIVDNAKVTAAIAQAIKAAKLPHVVLLSSVGAQHPDGTGPIRTLHVAERELAATGARLTAIRPSYFQENWGSSLGSLASGTIYSFLPTDLKFSQVATADIGRTVASALVEGTAGVIELLGPEASGNDVAAILTKLTGKQITVAAAPLDAVVPTFAGFGISTQVAELYREMYAGIISGRVGVEGGHRTVRGKVTLDETLKTLLSS